MIVERGHTSRVAVLFIAAFLPLASWTGATEPGNTGFVRTQGGRFVLNGAPFYFVGNNAYYLMSMTASGSRTTVEETMQAGNELNFTVLRTWAFADGTTYGPALQPSPRVYGETTFQALDYVLYRADQSGIRLILPLVNGHDQYGGVRQYVEWCAPSGSGRQAFFTLSGCRQIYKDYVAYVLNRVNTYNGRPYKDDPTIFAWELANEPHLPDNVDRTGGIIRAWVAEMAAYIKSLDSNHMVGTGEEGYDTTPQDYAPLSAYNNQAWLFDGTKGVSFSANTADSSIDFGTIHLYPEYWNLPVSAGNTWIADHIRIARQLGKPLLLGEFGYSPDPATTYEAWLRTWDAENGGGALVWQVMCPDCYDRMRDQFGVKYPPNSAVSCVVREAGARARRKSGPFTLEVPSISLGLDQDKACFRSAQSLGLAVTVTPGGPPIRVNGYVAVVIPGGLLLFLQGDGSLTTEWRPIVTNWTVTAFIGEIFRYTFSGREPPGTYSWYAAFTVPGGNPAYESDRIGPIVSAPFSFSP